MWRAGHESAESVPGYGALILDRGPFVGGCVAVLGIDATSSRNRWFARDNLSVQGQGTSVRMVHGQAM